MNRFEGHPDWVDSLPEVVPAEVGDAVYDLPDTPSLELLAGADIPSPAPFEEALPEVVEYLPEADEVLPVEPLLFAEPVELPTPVMPRAGRGWPIVAWGIIGVLVSLIFFGNHILPSLLAAKERLFARGKPASETDAEDQEKYSDALMRFQARYIIGVKSLLGVDDSSLQAQVKAMNTGPAEQRLRAVTVAGELVGPAEAIQELNRLEREATLTPVQHDTKDRLRRLYRDYERQLYLAPSLTNADRAQLKQDLGWFGELALAPPKTPDAAERAAVLRPARAAVIVLFSVAGVAILLGLVGLCLLIVFAVFFLAGWLRRAFGRPGPYGGIYAETFALWFILFLGLMLGNNFFEDRIDQSSYGPWKKLLFGLVELGTLVMVFWPVLRGVPWREVRHDLGLHLGRRPLAEPFLGLATYVMSLPLMGVGMLVMVILMLLTGGVPGMGGGALLLDQQQPKHHPIVQEAVVSDWSGRLQLLFLLAVVAPIVEEIMFRGVLYRHLRDVTGRYGFLLSLFFSGTLASFIFAVIHPQDPRAFPVLMCMAYGFTLAREWRGTVIPGIVMHALHNGVITCFLLFILSE